MRDAFGGTFMIQIFLIFIMIYICFTAMALNYAKAFKVKNTVIEFLESNEITNLNHLSAEKMQFINNFFDTEILGNMNYNLSTQNICNSPGTESSLIISSEEKVIGYCHNAGVIIQMAEISDKEKNTEGVYYTVKTYIGWSIPFLNKLLALNGNNKSGEVPTGLWEISGQTRMIVNE